MLLMFGIARAIFFRSASRVHLWILDLRFADGMLRLSGSFLSPLALFLVSSVVCVALVAETTLVSGRFVGGFTHATTCDRLPESLYRFHQMVVSGKLHVSWGKVQSY